MISNLLFWGIPKMCARILAHAATKSMACWSSLSQTRWLSSDFSWEAFNAWLKFFNESAKIEPHLEMLQRCWSFSPGWLISLLHPATLKRDKILLISMRKWKKKDIYETMANLHLVIPSNSMVLVICASSTNCPYLTNTWYHHEKVLWIIFLDRSRKIGPKLAWKFYQYCLCHCALSVKLPPLLRLQYQNILYCFMTYIKILSIITIKKEVTKQNKWDWLIYK